MANCPGSCVGSNEDLLTSILNQSIAYGVRLTQVAQAFSTSNGVAQPAISGVIAPVVAATSCADAESELLEAILAQRAANFNTLQAVLLAV